MTCIAQSAKNWRDQMPGWDDDYLNGELIRAWVHNIQYKTHPLHERNYHDWAQFRAATLREARKRGLDISATGLGT